MWLIVVALMVLVMVVLGGLTRLTESGLSIVDWRPVTGTLPPLGEAEWQAAFERYRDSPEFRRNNFWMTLADFKGIFWLEYLHRLLGRLIGVAFLLPFLYFLARGRITRDLAPRLTFAFLLGAGQGILGWLMVRSGLVDEPTVSQYRLAAHLGLAVLIYGYLLWLGWELIAARGELVPRGGSAAHRSAHRSAVIVLIWAFITLISGAFVAGLDAGLAYNTFPLMGGRIVPEDIFLLTPLPLNFFENAATVQFTHRSLAILLAVVVIWLWMYFARNPAPRRTRRAFAVLASVALLQTGLGVATLLTDVDVSIATSHQAGAMALFTAALWAAFATRGH